MVLLRLLEVGVLHHHRCPLDFTPTPSILLLSQWWLVVTHGGAAARSPLASSQIAHEVGDGDGCTPGDWVAMGSPAPFLACHRAGRREAHYKMLSITRQLH